MHQGIVGEQLPCECIPPPQGVWLDICSGSRVELAFHGDQLYQVSRGHGDRKPVGSRIQPIEEGSGRGKGPPMAPPLRPIWGSVLVSFAGRFADVLE